MKLAIPVAHGHSAGNVPDEWVFSCKRSARDFVLSPNRTKKWQNTPLAMKGLRFVYKNQYSSSNRTKNSRFEGCSTENL